MRISTRRKREESGRQKYEKQKECIKYQKKLRRKKNRS
jgi:hypothetical protein